MTPFLPKLKYAFTIKSKFMLVLSIFYNLLKLMVLFGSYKGPLFVGSNRKGLTLFFSHLLLQPQCELRMSIIASPSDYDCEPLHLRSFIAAYRPDRVVILNDTLADSLEIEGCPIIFEKLVRTHLRLRECMSQEH